ncbi:MAG: type II secretion system protein [Candidatus Pacebacteria bacterium]|nr:type II secretion system protein [Candidatus Paceibacterota bacterium]
MSETNSLNQSFKKGFTLIELLVVIAILAVLMSVVVIAINPAEMLKKSRDTRRVSDLDSLRTALNLYLSEDRDFNCTTTYAYISVPLASATTCTALYCGGTGKTCYCAANTSYRNIGTTGWVPIDFNVLTMRSALSSLPVDPTNNTSSGLYYLFAVSSSKTTYELNAKMESTNNASLMSNDGGSTSSWYEIGSDLFILN